MNKIPDNIRTIKCDDFLVKMQENFFGSRGANPESICTFIANGALILGANEIDIKQKDGWWFISADVDWLEAQSKVMVNESNVFDTIHAFPEAGVNCHRSEVMARIFSDSCFTKSNREPLVISGKLPNVTLLNELLEYAGIWARTIVFKFKSRV